MKDSISTIISRRAVLQGITLGAAAGIISSKAGAQGLSIAAPGSGSTLTFKEIQHGIDHTHYAPDGYTPQVLLRWGDPLFTNSPAFDLANQTAAGQEKQFGYNCDFTAFMPLPIFSQTSDHGLLVVNHEFTNPELMLPPDDRGKLARMSRTEKDAYELNKITLAMAAHGISVVEIKKQGNKWETVLNSPRNRRITAQSKIAISGPAAGHDRMKTSYDPAGTEVWGTLANCSGGVTPWGTILSGEENIHYYFGGKIPAAEEKNYLRNQMGSASNKYHWENFHSRFDMDKEPNEPNRYGWIVEFDPYDPDSKPVKRTALGRFKHEGASAVINKDNRIVVYMGDDGFFEYIYRFVSKNKLDYTDRRKNANLLDEGTLYVAKFNEDSTLKWIPLVQGQGKLTAENGFASQADILIDTRRAAELVGATPMDKPEAVNVNPVTGHVFAMLSNNGGRSFQDKNAANPRPFNKDGHIIEFVSLTGDHTDEIYGWDFFILCGDPMGRNTKTSYGSGITRDGWLSCPDNCAFDKRGRIWIATDQGSMQSKNQIGDGLYASESKGPAAAVPKFFYRVPVGAELCGPSFTPDNKTLFVSVQHPGEGDGSTFKNPFTRWPDFDKSMPPRPSVVAITKDDGGEIGS